MCGIIGVISRPTGRAVPTRHELLELLDRSVAAIGDPVRVTEAVAAVDALLRGVPGVMALTGHDGLVAEVVSRLERLEAFAHDLDAHLEQHPSTPLEHEQRSAEAIALRDVLWAVRHDRLRTAGEVSALAGPGAHQGAVAAYLAIQQSLSALDRLEVRGRDSAGIHVLVHHPALDLADPDVVAALGARSHDPTFMSTSVRVCGEVLSFVYKAAAEIGELSDNTRVLRAAVVGDDLLRRAVASDDARVAVLGHTRWASVGIISEPNTHPLNSDELETSPVAGPVPYVVAALNGDVDNHDDLRRDHQLRIHQHITTDAKVPTCRQHQRQSAVPSDRKPLHCLHRTHHCYQALPLIDP